MVEYNPREGKLKVDDTTEEEIWRLKRALDILFTMITGGRNLTDIQMAANKLAVSAEWPYLNLDKPNTIPDGNITIASDNTMNAMGFYTHDKEGEE